MKYTDSHEWVTLEGPIATVGITEHAQSELGDIVYVELPKVGHTVKAGDEAVVLESTKAAVDIYTPLSGTITAVNTTLKESPQQINSAPESTGWLFKLHLSHPSELANLRDHT